MARRLAALCSGIIRSRSAQLTLGVVAIIGVAIAAKQWMPAGEAEAQAPPSRATERSGQPQAKSPGRPQHDVMAIVNGEDINRRVLEKACVDRYGEDVLQSLIKKELIRHHCQRRNIVVSRAEVEAEIDRIAKRFRMSREQWLNMLAAERDIKPDEYRRDIVWVSLALRKLAASRLEVSPEELQQAYNAKYGPAIRARLIVVEQESFARKLQADLQQNPEDFARAAIDHSIDVNSASIGGLIQPIRRGMGDPTIETEIFRTQVGQVTPVIRVANQFVMLKNEGALPASEIALEAVQEQLTDAIQQEKLREVAAETFEQLQQTATIKNVFNDPQLRETMPGVVALVNGEQVTYRKLAEESLQRHGEEVISIEIGHMLLRQALARNGLQVTQAELDREIANAAQLAGVTTPDGKADVAKWLQMATEERGVSAELYIRDSVWPSAALKQLTRASVQVTEEDLQKAFEANYGEKVRCRAIVLANQRRAQQVWELARANPSPEAFGELAKEYSVEPSTAALGGEVPPIRRHGGKPQLEKAAFALQAGQLSGIVSFGDKFVIMRCEGRTEPLDVTFGEVRDILLRDIFEKKLRLAMAKRYEKLMAEARIDNYWAGVAKAPSRPQGTQPPQAVQDGRVVPASAQQETPNRR